MNYKKYLPLATAMLVLFTFTPARATNDKLYNYPVDMLFNSIYRFLTLDKGFEVTQENPEIGLIKFVFVGGGITDKSSSIEVVENAAGPDTHRVRVQIPSGSGASMAFLMDELNKKIASDYSSPAMGEQNFDYPYEKLFPSVYRYLAVDKEFTIIKSEKEKGIIRFRGKSGEASEEASFCEIFKLPDGSNKVRLKIASLSSSSLRTYLLGISEKLKKDYSGAL